MALIALGDFTLNSGLRSRFKLECDQFIEDNLAGLTELLRELAGPFSSVEGVPTGGLRLAEALRPFAGLTGPLLVVDDVLTTGRSVQEAQRAAGKPAIAVVVFARGQRPFGVRALFDMPECFWLKPRQR